MKKLPNHHYAAGMETTLLKKLPMLYLGGLVVPLLMSAFARIYPFTGTVIEIARLTTTIDIIALSMFISINMLLLLIAIVCVTVKLMKGPAYVADAYELVDSDQPLADASATQNTQRIKPYGKASRLF